jgi:hypothetical protein
MLLVMLALASVSCTYGSLLHRKDLVWSSPLSWNFDVPEDTEEEVTDGPHSSEYLNEKDAILSSAAKLIAHGMVPKVSGF